MNDICKTATGLRFEKSLYSLQTVNRNSRDAMNEAVMVCEFPILSRMSLYVDGYTTMIESSIEIHAMRSISSNELRFRVSNPAKLLECMISA